MHCTSDKSLDSYSHLINRLPYDEFATLPFPITDDCVQEILTFFSHLISPLTLTNLVMGCFDFSSLSNPLPVALHDGQAQYCAWHLQPALVGSSFPSSVICNLMSVTCTSSKIKPTHEIYCIVFVVCLLEILVTWKSLFRLREILCYCYLKHKQESA